MEEEVDVSGCMIVPEETIEIAATMAEETTGIANNSFRRLLLAGADLRDVGLTPMYLCTPDMLHMYVVSVENLHKKLN